MGTLRKYLFNGVIISSLISGVGALRQQRKQPADWRTVLTWASWILSFIVAVGTVRIDSQHADVPKPKTKEEKARRAREEPATGPKPIKRAPKKACAACWRFLGGGRARPGSAPGR
ncbi:MAG: hypothetical protein ACTHJL_03220 [Amnibacterium sp.]